MTISYIPKNIPPSLTGNELAKDYLAIQISKALNHSIIEPFKEWLYISALKGLIISREVCMTGCAIGIIVRICGIKKGEKIAIVSFLVYIGTLIIKVVFM